jgi:arylformamidase
VTDWIDISVGITNRMPHWPGDPAPRVRRVADMSRGDVCNVTAIDMPAHTGTHMDAPLHFVAGGAPIDTMPLDATVGEARLIAIENEEVITPAELAAHHIQRGERLLFKTVNSDRCWQRECFLKHFVHLSADASRYLVNCGVRTVGVDYLSIGAYQGDGVETHQILLGGGVWAIEGLDLAGVPPGRYELICLPLKLVGADGAPARAIVRPLQ